MEQLNFRIYQELIKVFLRNIYYYKLKEFFYMCVCLQMLGKGIIGVGELCDMSVED